MNAMIPKQNPGMDEVRTLFSEKLKAASLNGFMLGGATAMRLAAERFGGEIRKARTFEEIQPLALGLLEYLEDKTKGLNDISM